MELEPLLAEQAKVRQVEAGKNTHGHKHQDNSQLPQKIGEAVGDKKPKKKNESTNQAATQIGGTNAEYVRKAKKIERDAPELLRWLVLV